MTALAAAAGDEMRIRLRRAYLFLLTLLAGGLGAVLGIFVTPHLGKILAVAGTLALIALVVIAVTHFFRAPWADEIEAPADGEVPALEDARSSGVRMMRGLGHGSPTTDNSGATDRAFPGPLPQGAAPRVQLLGPVRVLNPRGITPTSETGIKQWRSQELRATELIAFLITHPGAKTKAVHEAMWGAGADVQQGTQSRNRLTNSARRWLGHDEAGREYFPVAWGGVYNLHEAIRSDWDDWCELVGDRPAAAATEQLVRALQLVIGQPFGDVKDRYYGWAMNELKPIMITAIADAADELAHRALGNGDTRIARFAAAKGLLVEPENEAHWRNALRAEHLAGAAAGIERILVQLEGVMKQMGMGSADLEAETLQVIRQVRGRAA